MTGSVAQAMANNSARSVLQRKTQTSQTAQSGQPITPSRAARVALERTAARDLGFMLTVTSVEISRAGADDLAADLPEMGLIMLLDGVDGVPGAMVLDPQMTAALIEVQTTGRVTARPARPRAPTRTDAAIATPLVRGFLARLDGLLPGDDLGPGRFRFGAMVSSGASMALTMGTGGYRILRLGCLLGADRAGELILALPIPSAPSAAPHPASAQPAANAPAPDGIAGSGAALRARLLDAPARLEAVLHRMTVPLAELRALQPGDVLRLPAGAQFAARLESTDGRLVAEGRLGQLSGQRAVRLCAPDAGDTRPEPAPPPPALGSAATTDAPAPASLRALHMTEQDLPDLSDLGLPGDFLGDPLDSADQ